MIAASGPQRAQTEIRRILDAPQNALQHVCPEIGAKRHAEQNAALVRAKPGGSMKNLGAFKNDQGIRWG